MLIISRNKLLCCIFLSLAGSLAVRADIQTAVLRKNVIRRHAAQFSHEYS